MTPQKIKGSVFTKFNFKSIPLNCAYKNKLIKAMTNRHQTNCSAGNVINFPKTGVNPHRNTIKCSAKKVLLNFNYLGALFNKTNAIKKKTMVGIQTATQGTITPEFPMVLKI